MTHAERIVSTLLEYGDSPDIRGEYWFIDGDAWFSDGDVGDVNHEGYAIQHAASLIMDHFGGKEDEFYDEEQIKDAAISWLYDDHGIEATDENWEQLVIDQFKVEAPERAEALAETFYCALQRGDARDTAMKLWGWKWCRGTNIGTWTFTASDRSDIVAGYDDVLSQEGEEGMDYDQMEITIGVGATGKRYSMTLGELKSGRTPSVDPTWGVVPEAEEGEIDRDEQLLNDIGAHVAAISTNRKLQPGEEVSRGTFTTRDLVRRTLEKLKEIHYAGWERFNEDYNEGLTAMEDPNEEEQYPGETAADYVWEALSELMNDNYCPFGTYFGGNEGSSSDIGCWPSLDYLNGPESEEMVTKWEISSPEAVGFLSGEEEPITDYVLIETPGRHTTEYALYDRDGNLIWRY